MDWVRKLNPGNIKRPLLKRDIEEAQRHSRGAKEAARWLNVHYNTYKKYARLYGVHEQHVNWGGKGITRPGGVNRRYVLEDVIAGKHPTYPLSSFKKRLISAGLVEEKCHLCGMEERREVDFKMPLMLVFKDLEIENKFAMDNVLLLCFNCTFLTAGNLNHVNVFNVERLSKFDDHALKGEDMMGLSEDEMRKVVEEAKSELE